MKNGSSHVRVEQMFILRSSSMSLIDYRKFIAAEVSLFFEVFSKTARALAPSRNIKLRSVAVFRLL